MIYNPQHFKEFQLWDEENDIPQNVVALFPPQKLQELLYYMSKPQQYNVYYYLDGANWMIHIHDRHADEQLLFLPVVISIVFPPTECLKIIEGYF